MTTQTTRQRLVFDRALTGLADSALSGDAVAASAALDHLLEAGGAFPPYTDVARPETYATLPGGDRHPVQAQWYVSLRAECLMDSPRFQQRLRRTAAGDWHNLPRFEGFPRRLPRVYGSGTASLLLERLAYQFDARLSAPRTFPALLGATSFAGVILDEVNVTSRRGSPWQLGGEARRLMAGMAWCCSCRLLLCAEPGEFRKEAHDLLGVLLPAAPGSPLKVYRLVTG